MFPEIKLNTNIRIHILTQIFFYSCAAHDLLFCLWKRRLLVFNTRNLIGAKILISSSSYNTKARLFTAEWNSFCSANIRYCKPLLGVIDGLSWRCKCVKCGSQNICCFLKQRKRFHSQLLNIKSKSGYNQINKVIITVIK